MRRGGHEMLVLTQVAVAVQGHLHRVPVLAGAVQGRECSLSCHAGVRLGRESLEPALAPRVSEGGDCYSQEALCRLQRNWSAPV